jgi:hypothetical protein
MKEKSVIPINQEEISVYLKDIRKITVMTVEREKELAKKMLSGELCNLEKEEIKKWYDDRFLRSWNLRSVFRIFDSIDITKFPQEIYKRIFFINI